MEQKNVKQIAVSIVSQYMGTTTAIMYQEYYKDKDEKMVLSSIKELLNEYLGEKKSSEILSQAQLMQS
jgi:hypothetical protein